MIGYILGFIVLIIGVLVSIFLYIFAQKPPAGVDGNTDTNLVDVTYWYVHEAAPSHSLSTIRPDFDSVASAYQNTIYYGVWYTNGLPWLVAFPQQVPVISASYIVEDDTNAYIGATVVDGVPMLFNCTQPSGIVETYGSNSNLVVILRSSDLMNWTPIFTNQCAGWDWVNTFTDSNAPAVSYYEIVAYPTEPQLEILEQWPLIQSESAVAAGRKLIMKNVEAIHIGVAGNATVN